MQNFISIIKKNMNDEKDKQVIKNIFWAFLVKGGAIFVSLFTMPVYLKFFNNQVVLGLWFTVLSVMIWILSFDFGIGNGLRNKLVSSFIKGDKKEIKEYISSSYIIIAGIVGITLIFGYAISTFVDWNIVFNISKNTISEDTMLFTVRYVFIGIMLQFLLRLISYILYAMQKSALTNLLALITSIMQLIFILIAPRYDIETNLIMISIAYLVCINLPLVICTVLVFNTELKGCAPSVKYFNINKAKSVLSIGFVFFWNQIMYMIITVTNEFFITKFSGPEFVVEYSVYNKLFTLVGSLFLLALTPMWSAITKAFNEKDLAWLSKTYRRLNYMVILAIGCEILIIPFLQFIINIWLGNNVITVKFVFATIFALYGSVFVYQSVLSTIACGMGKIKIQAVCYTIAVISKFIIIYFGMKIFNSWIVIIIANIIILLPYCFIESKAIKNVYISKEKSLS